MSDFLQLNHPFSLIIFATGFSLLPFILLCFTPFIKFSVVFSLVKNSFGVQQFPSSAITSLLCLILSLYVMKPVILKIREQAAEEIIQLQTLVIENKNVKKNSPLKSTIFKNFITKVAGPVSEFLEANTGEREKEFFLRTWNSKNPDSFPEKNIVVLVPAFIISQLKQGFILGVALYLPMLFVDLIVSNVLVALGISMISPTIISLPLKLMLFISGDAWLKLCTSLLGSY